MQAEPLDLLIVGGGITGAAIARDAALRGLRVALVEKSDFAAGTSSKSARMIHGGLRYLEQFQFNVVFESCAERYKLRKLAPTLVKPTPFTLPVYRRSSHGLLKIRMGMWLYELMALFRNFNRHRIINREKTLKLEPALLSDGLAGAARYYDGLANDARLTLVTVRAAYQQGALVANYVQADQLLIEEGRVRGLLCRGVLSDHPFEVHAKLVINATGPWADELRQQANPALPRFIEPNRGSHLIVPHTKLPISNVVTFTGIDGKRVMYAIPWKDTCIVGPTDVDHDGSADEVNTSPEEARFIIDSINRAFPRSNLTSDDIISSFAGLRPLTAFRGKSAYRASRDHVIDESTPGLITIGGGKYTTHRRMAEDCVDYAVGQLKRQFGMAIHTSCQTASTPLEGFTIAPEPTRQHLRTRYPDGENTTIEHLVGNYGAGAETILQYAAEQPALATGIIDDLPYLKAEIPYAVECEMALTLTDFMARRTHIIHEATDQGIGVTNLVAELMGNQLGWDADEISRQIEAYQAQVRLTHPSL